MLKRAEHKAREIEERVPPVLTNRGFLELWLAQIISQTAQNAILYALIIGVSTLTDSAIGTSGIVLTFVVPTVVFGMFAGVLVDRWSKRRLLIMTNVGRAAAGLAFFFARDHVWALYMVTVVFASFSQLFTTTNAASIGFMVSRQQLISANSLFSLGFTVAQIAGLIFLAPLILKTAGAGPLFIITTVAFLVASLLARLLPPIGSDDELEPEGALPTRAELKGAASELVKALGVLRADPLSWLAMAHITISSTLVLVFSVLVPRYMQEILQRPSEDTVAVFAPVAFGALFGLRAVPWIVPRLGHTRTVALGLFGLACCLAAFGLVEFIAEGLERTERFNPFGTDQIFGQSILVAITIAVAGPMGVFYALLNAPAQTVLHERTPIEMRGRIFASQMVLANGVALLPLVAVGGIADLYGVSRVVLSISVLLAAGGALSLYLEQRWLGGESGPSPPAGGEKRRVETVAEGRARFD
jgi:MFS family permease